MSLTTVALTKEQLQTEIQKDLVKYEFLWSIFISALNSYRYDSVLNPFPPTFLLEDGEKNIEKLREVADDITDLRSINTSDCVELVHWVLNTRNFNVKLRKISFFEEIMKITGQLTTTPQPNYILEVIYNEPLENQFQITRGNKEVFYAYHGSRMENFYSILHNGLKSDFNKNSFYGHGTYLSTELSLCMFYSPSSCNLFFGDHVSCVAVCEVIPHPSIKRQTKKFDHSKSTSWFHSNNSIPENYYVIANDDLVRIKYLLVYCDQPTRRTNSAKSWVSNNRFAVLMIVYLIILISIGLFNSKTVKQFFK